MKYFFGAVLVVVLGLMVGCKPTGKTTDSGDSKNPNAKTINLKDSFTISRTPCFGRCPVFECTMHGDGRAIYKGSKNTPWIGEFKGNVPADTMVSLLKKLGAMNFDTMKTEYLSPIKDLPSVMITYKGKTVKGHTRTLPKAFNDFVNNVDSVIAKTKWNSVIEK